MMSAFAFSISGHTALAFFDQLRRALFLTQTGDSTKSITPVPRPVLMWPPLKSGPDALDTSL